MVGTYSQECFLAGKYRFYDWDLSSIHGIDQKLSTNGSPPRGGPKQVELICDLWGSAGNPIEAATFGGFDP